MKEVIKMLKIRLLHANRGDCIILTYGDNTNPHYIIIDSGIGKQCTRELKDYLLNVRKKKQTIDLIILTHYDQDHIQGFLSLLKYRIINSDLVQCVWMNYGNDLSKAVSSASTIQFNVNEASCKTTAQHGKDFYEYLCENKINLKSVILAGEEIVIDDAKFTILSPSPDQIKTMLEQISRVDGNVTFPYDSTRKKETANSNVDFNLSIDTLLKKDFAEDTDVANCSSIAFLFEYKSYTLLFLGDSAPSQIVNALNRLGYNKAKRLKLDLCKLSHHGSNHNTSDQLLEIIECNNYIISSDWNGPRPGKQCMSKIAVNNKTNTTFYCNHPHKEAFTNIELEQYNITFIDKEAEEIVLEE